MDGLIFKDWKARCSSLGHIMTCLPKPLSEAEKIELDQLAEEKKTGINSNGNKTKWTDTKQSRLDSLTKRENGEDELPAGALTHLDDVFRSQYWGRKRLLDNKYLEKGNLCEDDSLGLLSQIDNGFYVKNKDHYSNDFIQGTPDVVDPLIDTKSNYDLDSFDKATLTPVYEWQIKGYAWLIGKTEGTLAYCLVNGLIHHIQNERTKIFYALGTPDDDNDEWKEVRRQIERNHIFDIPAFQKAYPHYQFENELLDFSIPAELRVKLFKIELTEDDIFNIKRRVMMSRIYLCEREIEVKKQLNLIK
jgi:hypothetical protein